MSHAFAHPRPSPPIVPIVTGRPDRGTNRRRAASGAVIALVATAVLSGCAPAVSVPVAPHATDPMCATIVLALPELLNGMPRVATASQATAAWGDSPHKTIQFRCGVDVPGPTTDECVTVTDETGREIDWITVQDPQTLTWTMTTYGRSPAVEVTIPEGMSSSPTVDLTGAVSNAPATRHCM